MSSTAVSDAVSEILDSGFNFWQTCKTVNSSDMCLRAKLLQSCLTFCDPVNCSLPGSSVHGILQARLLQWVAVLSSWGSSRPRDRTCISCIAGGFFIDWAIPISSSSQGLFQLRGKGCPNSEGRDVPSMFVLFFSVRTPSRDAAEMSREVVGDPGSDSMSTAISPGYWVLEVIRSSQDWLTRQREREYSAYSCKRNSLLKLSWNIPSVFSLARVWRGDSQAVHLSTAGVYRAQLRVFVPLFQAAQFHSAVNMGDA